MVQIDNVKLLITGILVLMVPLVVFYLNFVEGMWTGTDYDWLGTLSMLLFLGLGVWAIREGLTSSTTTVDKPIPYPSSATPPLHPRSQFCTNCGTPRQPTDSFCGTCGRDLAAR